jgi:flagellar biogenesis protein FliO
MLTPGWSLIIALVVILCVAWIAIRMMRKYVEGPASPRDKFSDRLKK